MNQWVKVLLGVGAGLIAGGVGGFFIGKKSAQNEANEKADEEVAEMKAYYERKMGEKMPEKEERKQSSKKAEDVKKPSGKESGKGQEAVQYDKIYDDDDIEFEDGCDPTAEYDDDDELSEEEEEALENEEAEARERKNSNRRPRIISESSLDDLDETVSHELLYYYVESGTVYDEDDNELVNYEDFLGDCLNQYGFADEDNDEMIIYVRNFELNVVYEVQKVLDRDPVDNILDQIGPEDE